MTHLAVFLRAVCTSTLEVTGVQCGDLPLSNRHACSMCFPLLPMSRAKDRKVELLPPVAFLYRTVGTSKAA